MKRTAAIAAACALLIPQAINAQTRDPMVHGVYYRCDQSKEGRADEIIRGSFAPVFDLHLQSGDISAWGWLAHRAGGDWRRLLYWVAPSRDALFDALDRITERLNRDHGAATQELASICPSHDDYIWRSLASSGEPANLGLDRPVASLSTYYECDISREARADTLVTQVFAPVFDRHLSAGHIDGWSWLAHDVGGKLRRIVLFDGKDHKTILNTRDMMIADLSREQGDAVREFGRICNQHVDYLWSVAISRP